MTRATYRYWGKLQSATTHVTTWVADGASHFSCSKTVEILSGVIGFKLFSCRETPSREILHQSLNPMLWAQHSWSRRIFKYMLTFKSKQMMYLMFISYISNYLVSCLNKWKKPKPKQNLMAISKVLQELQKLNCLAFYCSKCHPCFCKFLCSGDYQGKAKKSFWACNLPC